MEEPAGQRTGNKARNQTSGDAGYPFHFTTSGTSRKALNNISPSGLTAMLLATHAGALWGDSVVVAGWSGAGWRSSELLDILITGAPKEHAAGGAPDGDGGSESL